MIENKLKKWKGIVTIAMNPAMLEKLVEILCTLDKVILVIFNITTRINGNNRNHCHIRTFKS